MSKIWQKFPVTQKFAYNAKKVQWEYNSNLKIFKVNCIGPILWVKFGFGLLLAWT